MLSEKSKNNLDLEKNREGDLPEIDADDLPSSERQPYTKTKLEQDAEELRERFLYLIEIWAVEKYRYDWLEKRTGIAAARWQNVLLDKQFPTLEMLMSICRYLPNYTYWLMTGREWVINEPNIPHLYLNHPESDGFNQFKTHREWLKRKRDMKKKSKLPTNP